MACRDVLLMAIHLGIQRVWLENDCQEVVRLWQADMNQRSDIVTILKEKGVEYSFPGLQILFCKSLL